MFLLYNIYLSVVSLFEFLSHGFSGMPPRSQKQKEAKARAVRRRAKHNNDVDVHESATKTYSTPGVEGRKLGGGANGGISNADELRRLRLKAIAREERRRGRNERNAATERKKRDSSPPALSPTIKSIGTQEHGERGTQEYGEGRRKEKEDQSQCSSSREGKRSIEAEMRNVKFIIEETKIMHAHDMAESGQQVEWVEVASTVCKIIRNAFERADRRELKCSNAAVWSKVVHWSAGRALLSAAGFVADPPVPVATRSLEMWRSQAIYTAKDFKEPPRQTMASALSEQRLRLLNVFNVEMPPPPPERLSAGTLLNSPGGEAQGNASHSYDKLVAMYSALLSACQSSTSSIPTHSSCVGAKKEGGGAVACASSGGGSMNDALSQRADEDGAGDDCSLLPLEMQFEHDMKKVLSSLGLSIYSETLLSLGYDDPAMLTQMLNTEFEEMCDLAGILPGHRCKLSAAVRSGAFPLS